MLVGQNERVHVDRWEIAPHVVDLETSIIREILKFSSQPGVISFAGGLPAAELFPLKDLNDIMSVVIKNHGPKCMQYSLSMGVPELRELLAERATQRGTPSVKENILMTAGSQQGLELVARAFIDRGDYVLTENPTYVGALQAFDYYQARYVTVPMDENGMIVEEVEKVLIKYRPKLIYTVSNFQNPTGITMSEDRRIALVKLATQYDIPIVDDNPYGDVRFEGERIPTLKSFGGDEVIALRSFSKVLAPGFRLGWMNGPKQIMPQFEKVKQCTDLHTNTFVQYVCYEYLKAGMLEKHIQIIRDDYRAKRDIMLKAMEEHFPAGAKWTHPNGGLFIWVELPESVSAKDLLPKAIEKKVAYVYGEPFFPNGGGENCMRLNFSTASHEQITEGIKRLGTLLKENM